MSDQQRQPQLSSPFSASPARLPSIARPEWPWSARSYTRGNSQSSMHSQTSSTTGSSHLQTSWEPSRSTSSAASSSGTPLPWRPSAMSSGTRYPSSVLGLTSAEAPRQWSFTVSHPKSLHSRLCFTVWIMTGIRVDCSRRAETPGLRRRRQAEHYHWSESG